MFTPKKFTHNPVEIHSDLVSENTETGRYYILDNGKKLPSVTTVTGFKKNAFFAKWRNNNPKEAKRVQRRGNKLHSIIEDYVSNKEITLGDIPPLECELFRGMQKDLDKIDNVRAVEMALASEKIGLAGRVDCIADFDNKLSIIDFKGSSRKKSKGNIENYFLQATAYALIWQEMTNEKIEQIAIIIGCETGDYQVFTENPINWVRPLYREIQDYNNHCLSEEISLGTASLPDI
tara:strand:+ start:1185 stop:1886 length:702 start_codon:yes stop_codon:yes gene_type:complete